MQFSGQNPPLRFAPVGMTTLHGWSSYASGTTQSEPRRI